MCYRAQSLHHCVLIEDLLYVISCVCSLSSTQPLTSRPAAVIPAVMCMSFVLDHMTLILIT